MNRRTLFKGIAGAILAPVASKLPTVKATTPGEGLETFFQMSLDTRDPGLMTLSEEQLQITMTDLWGIAREQYILVTDVRPYHVGGYHLPLDGTENHNAVEGMVSTADKVVTPNGFAIQKHDIIRVQGDRIDILGPAVY